MKSNAKAVTVSLDEETIRALEETRAELANAAPGMRVGRSDAFRVLVLRGRNASK